MGSDSNEERVVIEILKIYQWYLQEMIKSYEVQQGMFLKRKLMILRDYGYTDVNDESNSSPQNPRNY